MVSSYGNKQLMGSALHLAQLMGDSSIMDKLKKKKLYQTQMLHVTQNKSPPPSLNSLLTHQDQSIHQATKKLDFVKLCSIKNKVNKRIDGDAGNSSRWVVTKS
ncbi:hypothetical protein NC651_026360 [Populus alba x Populus x berolinensis]|nr:hypothetical protein NC651_026360 [Populus alba x Populus x berolinensis]